MKSSSTAASSPPPQAGSVIHAVHSDPAPTAETAEFRRRSYYGQLADEQAVATIRAKFGCSTDSDAVRLALRLVASDAIKYQLPQPEARRIVVKFSSRR